MSDHWPTSLITENAKLGYELAIELSRLSVKDTQPPAEVLEKLRPDNAEGEFALSEDAVINFQIVAAANNYWQD